MTMITTMTIRHRMGTAFAAIMIGILVGSSAYMLSPEARAAAAPESGDALVVVDAAEIGTMPTATVEDVARQATKVAVDAGIDPAAVAISFVEVDPVEIIRGVRVSIVSAEATLADPEGDRRGPLFTQCTACPDKELAGLAVEGMRSAVERYREQLEETRTAEAEAEAEPEPEPAVEPEPVDPGPEPKRKRKLSVMGWTGVVSLAVGVPTLGTGVVLAILPPAPFPREMRKDTLRNLRPTGYALLGGGAALAITGAVLLGLDRRRAKRFSASISPSITRGRLGVTLRTRF